MSEHKPQDAYPSELPVGDADDDRPAGRTAENAGRAAESSPIVSNQITVDEAMPARGTPMEIHPPERPMHSVKDFLLQILTITVGILIALSLEALLTAVHHRSLVREARANLVHELQANRREVNEAVLKEMPRLTTEQDKALAVVEAFLARHPPASADLRAVYRIAQVTSTSWTTAQRSGAVAFMEYGEIERFANVYELQARFSTLQDRLVEAYVTAGPGSDPDSASVDELRQWKQRIVTIQAHLQATRQLGQALVAEYDKALKAMAEQ